MQIYLFKTHKLIKKILYIISKREDSFSLLLLKLLGGALLFLLFPISTYSQDFYAQQNGGSGFIIMGDAKIITLENTSLKESRTENVSKEEVTQTSLKDDAKVSVKKKTIKNSLAQTKKTNSEKYKNIEEKIKKNLQKTEYTNPFSSTGLANRAKTNANAAGKPVQCIAYHRILHHLFAFTNHSAKNWTYYISEKTITIIISFLSSIFLSNFL